MTEDERREVYMMYVEEICADAYAGIRRGGINTVKAEQAMETFRTDRTDGGKETAAATDRTNGPGENKTADTEDGGEQRYSIIEDFVDNDGNHYDRAVLLDTDVFDGVSPRNWAEVLKNHIESRVEKSTVIMPVEDENGDWQDLEFAKKTDRIETQSGNSRFVLSELYWTRDNISKLSAVHIDEIVAVSEESVPYHTVQDALHNHGWLDKNGFLHRSAYVINAKNGNVYRVALDIAKADDGRMIAFALNGKTERTGNVNVNSLGLRQEAQLQNTNPSVQNNNKRYGKSQEENVADAAYLPLAEKYRDGTATEAEAEQLRKMVDEAAKKAMPNTKILDEDGNLLTVYHGTSEQFTEFDMSKGRTNMDINGSFFSPWELDAQGYGENVGKYYLNITNPANESTGYNALHRFQGQNKAGVKAREYLESLGYDGVNNENEEYIAFYPNQIKSADLVTYDDNGDIIPLSERFRTDRKGEDAWKNDDLRFSVEDDNAELDEGYQRSVQRDAAEDEPTENNLNELRIT